MAKDNQDTITEAKPRRGRPKKKVSPIVNEEAEVLTMSKAKQEAQKRKDIDNGVTAVKESMQSTTSIPENLTFDDLQTRWAKVFGKCGTQVQFKELTEIWANNTTNMMTNNPFIQNRRVKNINTAPAEFSKDEIEKMMQYPESHEIELRAFSWYMYYTNYIYRILTQLNRDVAKFNYYYTPLYIDPNDKESIAKDSARLDKLLKVLSPASTFKTMISQIMVEGKCAYLVRESFDNEEANYLMFQKLNSDQIKIVGLGGKQRYVVSFNMAIFLEAGYSVSQYPQFIRDAWEEMITNGIIITDKKGNKRINPKAELPTGHMLERLGNGQWMYWLTLPQSLAYVFYSDGASNNAFGDMIGLLPSLGSLKDFEWLEGNLASRGTTAVLTGEVPLIGNQSLKPGADQTAISPDQIVNFTDLFNSLVSEQITGFFAPFTNYKLHELSDVPNAMQIVQERIKEVIAASGNSGLITLTDKPSIASVKTAQKLQASRADYITRQFENCLNDIINSSYNLKNVWHVFLHGDIFSDEENEKVTKELVMTAGAKGLIPKLLSYEGLTIEDYKGAETYLSALGIEIKSDAQKLSEESLKQEVKLQKANITTTTSDDSTSNPVGRPKLSDDNIDNDNTGTSADAGNNVSDIK